MIVRGAMPFENVAEKNHDVRPPRFYLGNPGRGPTLAELRTEMHIGQSDKRCSVHGPGKAGEDHLVFFYYGVAGPG